MSVPLRSADSILAARWVVPVEPANAVLEDHAVVIGEGRIVAVEPTAGIESRWRAKERIDLPDHVLLPGLVNAHTHAAMVLLRGLSDDLPLMRWLREHIWPAEMKHVSERFVYDGTRAAAVEMLLSGITTANDMYFYPDAAGQAFVDVGMRAVLGVIAVEFPTPYAADADDYLAKGLATRDRFREEALLSFAMAPHAPYTVSDRTLTRVATIAEELDLPIHTHVHETVDEIEASLREHGRRPLERLAGLGLLSPRLIAVHAVHLDAAEQDALARHGVSVAHCPSSNLKLASGCAPIESLRKRGVNIALGTDGAASNNRLDLWSELRTAALLAKAVANEAEAFPAFAAIEAATLGGARALGLERSIGSLVPGKAADIIAVDLSDPRVAPCYRPLSHLAYVCGRDQVTDVWVAGGAKVRARRWIEATGSSALESVRERVCLWQNILVS